MLLWIKKLFVNVVNRGNVITVRVVICLIYIRAKSCTPWLKLARMHNFL